jgi:3-oxoadipate enol-lactonase
MWNKQAAIYGANFRVLQYDTRGHGQTDVPQGDYTWEQLTNDIISLWDMLGIKQSHFVGLSLGGMTGIGLALNYAERLLSLTACDCRADAPLSFQNMWDKRCAGIGNLGMAATYDMTMTTWFTEGFLNSGNEIIEEVSKMVMSTPVKGYLGCVGALRKLDYKKRMAEIKTPTLFVCGEFDGPHPAEMKTMHELVLGSLFKIIPNAAHISNMEQPDTFNQYLNDFLVNKK